MNISPMPSNIPSSVGNLGEIQWDQMKPSSSIKIINFISSLKSEETTDCLKLLETIALKGDKVAKTTVKNLDSFPLTGTTVSDRLKLCKLFAFSSGHSAIAVAKNFEKFDLKNALPAERLGIGEIIASHGSWEAADLASNFKKFTLQDTSHTDLLEFCEKIAHNGFAAQALAYYFNLFGLQDTKPHERLKLANIIASQGVWAVESLVNNIEKFVLRDTEVTDRFKLFETCALQPDSSLELLIKHIHKFGLQDVNPSDLLELCKKLILSCEYKTRVMIKHFNRLKLQDADPFEKFKLCEMIVSKQERSAGVLVENFEKFGLQKLPPSILISFCERIIKKCGEVSQEIPKNFEKFRVHETELESRLRLCELLISQNIGTCQQLAEHFEKLRLQDAPVEDRLRFCNMMILRGDETTQAAAKNLKKFELGGAAPEDLLKLYKTLSVCSNFTPAFLAENFDLDHVKNTTVDERVKIAWNIITSREVGAIAFLENFERFGLLDLSPLSRLYLCQRILDTYPSYRMVVAIVANYAKFKLENVEPANLLRLCETIVSIGEWSAGYLARYFRAFEKLITLPDQLFKLSMKIVTQGKTEAESLLQNETLSPFLQTRNLLERLGIAKAIALQSPASLVKNVERLGLNIEEVEEILLSYPGHLFEWASYLKLESHSKVRRQALIEVLAHDTTEEENPLELIPSAQLNQATATFLLNKGDIAKEDARAFEYYLRESPKLAPLLVLFKITQDKKDDQARHCLNAWIAYAAAVLSDLSDEQSKMIHRSGLLDSIYHYPSPPERYALMRNLSYMAKNEPRELQELDIKMKDWTLLSAILLSRLIKWGATEAQRERVLKTIDSLPGFKDTQKSKILFQFLLAVIDKEPFRTDEIEVICDKITQALKVPKEMARKKQARMIDIATRSLSCLSNILQLFGKDEFFNFTQRPEAFFAQKFRDLFAIECKEDISERYDETFAKFRDPTALFVYLSSVNKLKKIDKGIVSAALRTYVQAVIEGTFPEMRYRTDESPHLRKVFESNIDLKKTWTQKTESKVIARNDSTTSSVDYTAFFQQKILRDHHLDANDFPILTNYLNGVEVEIPVISDGPTAKFESLAIQLCQGDIDARTFLCHVEKLEIDLGEHRNDLKALIPKQSPSLYTISESDDACDLLLIGTEVNGSCQRVNGTPNLNKCLTGYLINGEIRAIVVKDNNGKIVARSIIRLLWDEIYDTPVLLMERIYANMNDDRVIEAINAWAIERAEQLKIPLVCKETNQGIPYEGNVAFLGGRAPYLYSDAGAGIHDGPFKVERCRLLNTHFAAKKKERL